MVGSVMDSERLGLTQSGSVDPSCGEQPGGIIPLDVAPLSPPKTRLLRTVTTFWVPVSLLKLVEAPSDTTSGDLDQIGQALVESLSDRCLQEATFDFDDVRDLHVELEPWDTGDEPECEVVNDGGGWSVSD